MKWAKRGRVYSYEGHLPWARHSCLQPTPLVMPGGVIRLFIGLRDQQGVARIGYIDVDADNPSKVLEVCREPVLDVGAPGAFDDNGVVPSAVARDGDRVYLHYAGYQQHFKIRFTVLGGLAVSDDGGRTFRRWSTVPALERTPEEMFFRVAHTILREGPVWRVWYGGGGTFLPGATKTLPVYDVRYMESADGVTFQRAGRVVLPTAGGEYRIGRPYVVRHDGLYRMVYGIGTRTCTYRLGYAESPDGLHWTRKDNEVGIDLSPSGWDSKMMAYPSVVTRGDKTWLFYNGNDYGRTGVGYAELVAW
jgi:hypothetical protein